MEKSKVSASCKNLFNLIIPSSTFCKTTDHLNVKIDTMELRKDWRRECKKRRGWDIWQWKERLNEGTSV